MFMDSSSIQGSILPTLKPRHRQLRLRENTSKNLELNFSGNALDVYQGAVPYAINSGQKVLVFRPFFGGEKSLKKGIS